MEVRNVQPYDSRFYRWLMEKLSDDGILGEVARYLRDNPQHIEPRRSENLANIASEMFRHRVDRRMRRQIRAAFAEWRLSLLVKKYGEWPIRTKEEK